MFRFPVSVRDLRQGKVFTALVVYLGAAWAVLEVADHAIARFLLPEWVYTACLILLLAGLPVVLATAVLQDGWPSSEPDPEDPTLLGEFHSEASESPLMRLAGQITWRKTIVAGMLGFIGLALAAGLTVLLGFTRITEARGSVGDGLGDTIRIGVADFEADADTRDIAEAARLMVLVDLGQSADVKVYGPGQLEAWMRQLDVVQPRTPGEEVVLQAAREGGLGAVLRGAVHSVGDDYLLVARVIGAESGRDLVAVRVAARAERLFEGLERLSTELRRRLGEAKDEVRRMPSVAQVAGGFFERLERAIEAEDLDRLRGLWLLDEAEIRSWADFFEFTRDVDVTYVVRSAERSDAGLTVDVDTRYSFFNESSQQRQTSSFVWSLRLEKRADGWVAVEYETA